MVYHEDLTGLKFGKLTVLGMAPGYVSENKMWRCKCECGRENCKKTVVLRRGNLTRKVPWVLTCGAGPSGGINSVKAKLKNGVVQKNSKTGVTGVSFSLKYPGKYRARMDFGGNRRNKDNLSFEEAVQIRSGWEDEKKNILGLTDCLENKDA